MARFKAARREARHANELAGDPALDRPWLAKGLRFALHLGVADPARPMLRHIAGSLDPIAHIELAAELGFAGITDNGMKLRSAEDQSAIGEALAERGLVMGSFTNSPMGTRDAFWGHPGDDYGEAFHRSIDASIEIGRRTGGRDVTLCSLRADTVPLDVQHRTFADRIRAAADRVAAAAMTLAIEPTSPTRTPAFLIHDVVQAAAIVRSGHPGVRLMFDTAHVHEIAGDPVAAFRRYRGMIDTVQIADRTDRIEPGAGSTDFIAFFRAVRDDGFAGLFELEHYHSIDGAEGERRSLERLAAIVAAI